MSYGEVADGNNKNIFLYKNHSIIYTSLKIEFILYNSHLLFT